MSDAPYVPLTDEQVGMHAARLDALSGPDLLRVLDAERVLAGWVQVDEVMYELLTRGSRRVATVWKAKGQGWHITGSDHGEPFLGFERTKTEAMLHAESEAKDRNYYTERGT